MCEIEVKLEDVRSKSPSLVEDIVDGFAFASFVCEDDLKEHLRRQKIARTLDVDGGDECPLSSLSLNASSSFSTLSRQSSVSQPESNATKSSSSGAGAKIAPGLSVCDTSIKSDGSSKKLKRSSSIAVPASAAFSSSDDSNASKSLTAETGSNGISLLLAAAESKNGRSDDSLLHASDVKRTTAQDTEPQSPKDIKVIKQWSVFTQQTPGSGEEEVQQQQIGEADVSPAALLPTHSSLPVVQQQQQPASSSSSSSSPLPSLVDVKAASVSHVAVSQAGGSNVTGLSSLRRSPPPPSSRTEFTKPVAVVSGSRIDDADKKNAQGSQPGSASAHGSISPRSNHQASRFPLASRSPVPRRPSSPASALRQMSGTPGSLSQPPFGYPPFGAASAYMYASPYSSLVPASGGAAYKHPGLALRPGQHYPDIMNPSAIQSAELMEAQRQLNERFLQDRVRGSPLSPFSMDLHHQQQLRQLSASSLFPPTLDKMMEYERALRQQQMPGYLPPPLPPLDMSLNRVGGTGLDLSGGRLPGSLKGAFQPKAVPPSVYGPFDPLYLSRKEQEKSANTLPSEPRKRGRWCAAHVQIAFQIHIAKQCARLEGRERPDRWSSGSIDLLRTPGRSDFMKPRDLPDPLRPVAHPSDVTRTPSHGDMFKVPSVLVPPSVDALRPPSHALRELERLRSSTELLRGAEGLAPSRADVLRSASITDAWSQQAEDVYNRSLSYLMSLRPGDMGLPQALQARAAMDAAAAYRNAGSLFGLTPPPAAGSSPYAYPPSLGIGSLGAFGAYKDGVSRSGGPERSADAFAEYLYRSQLMAGGQTNELKERGDSSSRLRELELSASRDRERQRDADGRHGDLSTSGSRQRSSHHSHSSQGSLNLNYHSDDRDRHRSRSPVRHEHRPPGERKELSSPTMRHSHHKSSSVHHTSSHSTDVAVKKTSSSSSSSNMHERDGRDTRDSQHTPSSNRPDKYPPSNHSSSSRIHSGQDRPQSGSSNNTRPSTHHDRQHSSSHDFTRLAAQHAEHSRSRSRSPVRSSADLVRQHSGDSSRHVREHGSSGSHRPHMVASGDQRSMSHAASHSVEPDSRSLVHRPSLHLPSPSSMPDAYRAMFALPDMYSNAAALPPVPKANLLLSSRDSSMEAMALMAHLSAANFNRLPT